MNHCYMEVPRYPRVTHCIMCGGNATENVSTNNHNELLYKDTMYFCDECNFCFRLEPVDKSDGLVVFK